MKKKLPLNVIKNLQLKNNEGILQIQPEEGDDFILQFTDRDVDSEFYFKIIKFEEKQNRFLIEYLPTSANSNAKHSRWTSIRELNDGINAWIKIISEYNESETVFDDPILRGFQQEYYQEFEIIDEDASTRPFRTKQILLLDQYLTDIETEIENFIDDENKESIEDIKSDIKVLKSELTKKSKKWVINYLSLIWGKITKQGPIFIKEFLNEAKKQVVKEGVKIFIDVGKNLLS